MQTTTTARHKLAEHLARRAEELSPDYIAPGEWDFGEFTFDPVGYTEKVLGFTYWSGIGGEGQLEIVEYYAETLKKLHEKRKWERNLEYDETIWKPGDVVQNWIRVEAGHTVGKCVSWDDTVVLADGSRVPAGSMVGQRAWITGKDGPVLAYFEDNGERPIFELETEDGFVVRRTGNHPLWSASKKSFPGKSPAIGPGGWVAVEEISTGDLVASIDVLKIGGATETLSDDMVKLVALLVGDGGLTGSSVMFSSDSGQMLQELHEVCSRNGLTLKHRSNYDYAITGGLQPILRGLGLWHKGSAEKFVPEAIMKSTLRQKALFLNYLFHTDGWYTSKGKAEIGYCSTSKTLVEQVALLLRQFGVHGNVCAKETGHAATWQVFIHRPESQRRFVERIGIAYKDDSFVRSRLDRKRKLVWRDESSPDNTKWVSVKRVERLGVGRTVAIYVPDGNTYATLLWEHNTFLAAAMVCHFFDVFATSIGYAFAPTATQINDLLFKEIRRFRDNRSELPGRVLQLPEIRHTGTHFIKGKATGNSSTEAVQGQHSEYQIFVLDEAEGIADFVYDAIESMTGGGISIVLMIANPRTNTSRFHKVAGQSYVRSFRLSCLNHPNVITGREIVPNAVKRDYVKRMVETECEVVEEHTPDFNTFEVDWMPGQIFKPNNEFLFRVMGMPPLMQAFDTFMPVGRYDVARKREQPIVDSMEPYQARIGVDSARYGDDSGTIYIKRGDVVKKHAVLSRADGYQYYIVIRELVKELVEDGVIDIHIRVDAGGGYSSTLVDSLGVDDDLYQLVLGKEVIDESTQERKTIKGDLMVLEVHFGGTPSDRKNFADRATEMYWHAAESCKNIAIVGAPDSLRQDLCERKYKYTKRAGIDVRVLRSKEEFRREFGRSPDHGDGFVLAAAPDHIFGGDVALGFA